METVNDTAMHVTETKTLCSSLTCPPSKSEEITKDQEEELLCGNSEDGDEEDALSDDSMRLRLSDDEAEIDDPSASDDVTTKKTSQENTDMELGSDVPATDTSEQKSALRKQNLSNGKCTEESKNMRVHQEDQCSNDAFAEENDSKYCNGDSAPTETKSTQEASTTQKKTDKWKFSGHFGDCPNRANQRRKPYVESNKYATDPYNDKYYNKNEYYGSNKGSSRVHNSYRKESSSPSPDMKESGREQSTFSQAIKSEAGTTKALDADNAAFNDGESRSSETGKTEESTKNSEDTNGLSEDNNSLVSKEVPQEADPVQENSNVDRESSNAIVKGDNDEVNVSNGSNASAATLVVDNLNNSLEQRLSEDKDVSTESESTSASTKVLDSESMKADEGTEKTNEYVGSEKTDARPDGSISGDNSAMQIEAEKEAAAEEPETEDSVSDTGKHRSSLERAEIALAAEIQNCDNSGELDKKAKEEESEKLDSPKPVNPVEETEKSPEDPTANSTAAKKQSVVGESEQAAKSSSIDATNESETVEEAVASVDMEVSSKPKILDIEVHIADLPDEKETSSEEEENVNNVRIHTSLKRASTEALDDMELFKRMRIRRRKIESDEPIAATEGKETSVKTEDVVNETEDNASTVDNPVTNSIAVSKSSSESSLISNTVVENSGSESSWKPNDVKPEADDGKENIEKVDDCEVIEVPVKRGQRRSRKSLQPVRETVISQEDTQEKENVRQKRRTARNAEEIIRKEFQGNSDSESNDSAGNLVAVNYNKTSNNLRAASPPTLKRNYVEEDEKIEPSMIKKLKHDLDSNGDVSTKTEAFGADKIQTLAHVRRFFRRDNNGKLAKLKQEELEELLIQKVVETITMRDEIGKLREQAKISERNQDATRLRCQQLAKQIKDFEMVLNRYQSDRRSNPDKTVVPIKINRSVGLQVNFVTDHGIQNLRQLGQIQKTVAPTLNGTSTPQQTEQPASSAPPVKRTIKVRSPRRPDPAIAPTVTTPQTPMQSQPIISNITPAALVVAKNVTDSRTPVSPTVQQTTVPHLIAPKQTIVVNGPLTNQSIRQATTIQVSKQNNSDLIDLTQEEDKTKSTLVPQNAILTTAISESSPSISNVQKIAPRFHTVIQTLPGSVAIAQPGIRVVQPSSQPTPTALVNNMNAPRLTYVMQSGMGSTRQVVVTSAPAPIRPAPTIRTSYPLSGTITNGTVRVIPMTSTATIQVYKHPAALPESLNSPSNASWKLPPPAPSLKISKVANGIVLSWNMVLTDKYAEIASYQLYAYQEVSGIAPSSTLWKKVGDVRALPLPMACTLTQFSEGNNYYFAVRAVDKHSRLGMYSQPGNISL